MTRLRYVVDNPRGPKGGNNDVPTIFKSAESARRSIKRGVHGTKGRVIKFDLDDGEEQGIPPELEHAHAERMMVKWSQRCLETRSGLHDSGPLFRDAHPVGELAAIPELRREDFVQLAEHFARWTAWRNTQRKKPYEAERELGDAIRTVLAKLGEAAR
jgi:hypothetical protein